MVMQRSHDTCNNSESNWTQGYPNNLMIKASKGQEPEGTAWEFYRPVVSSLPQISCRDSQGLDVMSYCGLPQEMPAHYLIATQLGTAENRCFCLPPAYGPSANSTMLHLEKPSFSNLSSHHIVGLASPHPGLSTRMFHSPCSGQVQGWAKELEWAK